MNKGTSKKIMRKWMLEITFNKYVNEINKIREDTIEYLHHHEDEEKVEDLIYDLNDVEYYLERLSRVLEKLGEEYEINPSIVNQDELNYKINTVIEYLKEHKGYDYKIYNHFCPSNDLKPDSNIVEYAIDVEKMIEKLLKINDDFEYEIAYNDEEMFS